MAKKREPSPIPQLRAVPLTVAPMAGVRLPAFSGDRTNCVKCGHRGARTLHRKAGATCVHPGEGVRVTWGMERLHRCCERCQFSWDEACVPAIPQKVGETLLMSAVRDE